MASYTHSAVDHLLLKLQEAGLDPSAMARLGISSSIDARLHPYIIDHSNCSSIDTMQTRLDNVRVVGCTVLSSARHALLDCVQFDWCVMDEAGQISQPAAMGALLRANKFVLVGDDYQLPPLIMSAEAKSMVIYFLK